MRELALRARNRLRAWKDGGAQDNALTEEMEQIISLIRTRQIAGEETTLRQLHKFSQLDQPRALSLVSELEREGLLVINYDLIDAFESVIALSE